MKGEKIKLILVGDTTVGKTSIINQYIKNTFSSEFTVTMAQDKSLKSIKLNNGKELMLEIWDTVGQEKLRSTNKIFMKNSKIALLVYDITNQKSFDDLNEFYEELNQIVGRDNIVLGVVGNKSDLYEDQVISKETGEEYANNIGALFFETTAQEHENIENLFNEIVNHYDEKANPNIEDPLRESFRLNQNNNVNNIIQDDKKNDDDNINSNPKNEEKVNQKKKNQCC